MGVSLSKLVHGKEIDLKFLSGKRIAIDAFNTIFQFLSIIRDRETGEPLKDRKGMVTSHLSGLLYRTANLVEAGIKPAFVFDGQPPEFKRKTIEERQKVKADAEKKMKEARESGGDVFKYAQATSRLTDDMIKEAKTLLGLMGIPWFQAPSEGEAQCAVMCKRGDVDYSASQDYDSLLFGSPHFIRNLSISGRKKMPGRNIFYELKPEVLTISEVLSKLGITHDQLIVLGMLIGTDYNVGVKGVGPMKALKIVKESKKLEEIINGLNWTEMTNINDVFEFFKNPPFDENYQLEWKEPDITGITDFMVDKHDFSQDRIVKVLDRVKDGYKKSAQETLGKWFKK
ncbi:MAG TPA: flap endonuclease-1 [archaeon]|nr:flap endonuclease-1 [archaeon]